MTFFDSGLTGPRRTGLAVLLAAVLTVSACGSTASESESADGDAVTSAAESSSTTSQATTTTTEAPTTSESPADDSASESESGGDGEPTLTAEQVADCSAPPLPGFPETPFRFIAEENLFECLGVDSYGFEAGIKLRSRLGADFDEIVFNAQATEDEVGDQKFRSFGSVDGRPFELVRVDDTLWMIEPDGSFETMDVGGQGSLALLGLESTSAQLSIGGAGLLLVAFYGGGAAEVGPDIVAGRPVTHWRAGPAEITERVNSAGALPVSVEVQAGSVDIWTDGNGFVLKAAADLDMNQVLLDGVPALDFPGAQESGLLFDGIYNIEYVDLGEPLTIEAPS